MLVLGGGVIGSVYAGALHRAGHHVVLLMRGRRLMEVRSQGLVLENAESGQRVELPVMAVENPEVDQRYDLVLVAVRAEQLEATLPTLTNMTDGSDVLFFGNLAGHGPTLVQALGERAVFGFPAAGGTRDGSVIRYVLIPQQKTTLGEPNGVTSSRIRRLQTLFSDAGFPVRITANVEGWLLGHAAFVVPMAFALYRVDTDAARLARDPETLRLMVRATRQAFQAVRALGIAEIPTNLTILYLRMPQTFAVRYWRRVLASPRGELWFAGHCRTAVKEMTALADQLEAAVRRSERAAPDVHKLLSRSEP